MSVSSSPLDDDADRDEDVDVVTRAAGDETRQAEGGVAPPLGAISQHRPPSQTEQ